MRLYKKYKETSPEETVGRIKKILFDCGIEVKEVEQANYNNTFFSAHLHICNGGLLPFDLTTNGKGISPEYALASAYGELMERIQTGILFKQRSFLAKPYQKELSSETNDLKRLNYYYAPDEIVLYGEEYKETIDNYVHTFNNEEVKTKYMNDFEILLPFYNVMDKRIDNIPQRILEHCCGSNGMCAGNTPQEAILQGIYEIFERYALRKLYEDNLTPPDIPIECFKDCKAFDYIQQLISTNGYDIKIKDCSVGKDLPVIGVLIIDPISKCYDFHLGADPVPYIALERVFTELYQNSNKLQLKPINFETQSRLLSDVKLKEDERVNYSFQRNNMPISIFGNKPSYYSKWFCSEDLGRSNDSDLSFTVSLLKREGYSLYVRDVSFLGFPSYIVYIPGMSELINVESMRWFNATFEKNDRITEIAHHLPLVSNSEIKELLGLISKFKEPEYLRFFNTDDVWYSGNPLFVLGVLAMVVADYSLAIKYLSKAITPNLNFRLKRLYSLFLDYASVINNASSYMSSLALVYKEEELELVNKCINQGEWRNLFNLSSCFDCYGCKQSSSCAYKDYSELLFNREKMYEANIIDQNKLINVFGV